MRILGLDYGRKRIGVAICDEMGVVARSLCAIERKGLEKDMAEIKRLAGEFNVEKIVIGYPLTLDGKEGIQCKRVSKFAEMLEERLSLPIVKWDESLSTKEAEDILIEADMCRKKRRKRVDKLAAAIILQRYLDRPKTGSLHEDSKTN
ncbi:MAG: Holliday junction resolvase RuvX [Thermodesulfobacteriota bacterium]|nr:Holliday junction resolvase RuvX [Thermodesulfobacteriota bacterium]